MVYLSIFPPSRHRPQFSRRSITVGCAVGTMMRNSGRAEELIVELFSGSPLSHKEQPATLIKLLSPLKWGNYEI